MKWDWDYLWHFLGGLLMGGIGIGARYLDVPLWFMPCVATGWGAVRELQQSYDKHGKIEWPWQWSLHRHIEAWLWPLGASIPIATFGLLV